MPFEYTQSLHNIKHFLQSFFFKIQFFLACMIFPFSTLAISDSSQPVDHNLLGRDIVESFMLSKGVSFNKQTDNKRYMTFMRGILLGEYPELTGLNSVYVKSQVELNAVIKFASEELNPVFQDYPVNNSIPEVKPDQSGLILDSFNQGKTVLVNYDRSAAINYAYAWWDKRNPNYPDFGENDCTNFISQAMVAGGFSLVGSGDGCRDEATRTEFYANANTPPWWCQGSNRHWEWSTSWSVVDTFRAYFADENNFATVLGWTTDRKLTKSLLSPGDIIQLQKKQGSGWIIYHNMLVTKEDSKDLYLTYHAFNRKDKPLSEIEAGEDQRYILVRFP
ncbi:amidase domain-containing protein [Zooshikella marina]|uniref:amidase domain-containing protein n=1 Tax=Zooshikella ganghwensis TaxID=202772 RepID=UPI001BAE7EC5|nr:amidase domain-containing protein [Zooshikella ganghwensis]MBU2706153.1 amidase domain-containing protein [Zooshikella ganghwensis]